MLSSFDSIGRPSCRIVFVVRTGLYLRVCVGSPIRSPPSVHAKTSVWPAPQGGDRKRLAGREHGFDAVRHSRPVLRNNSVRLKTGPNCRVLIEGVRSLTKCKANRRLRWDVTNRRRRWTNSASRKRVVDHGSSAPVSRRQATDGRDESRIVLRTKLSRCNLPSQAPRLKQTTSREGPQFAWYRVFADHRPDDVSAPYRVKGLPRARTSRLGCRIVGTATFTGRQRGFL